MVLGVIVDTKVSSGTNRILKMLNGMNGVPVSLAPGFPDVTDSVESLGIQDFRIHDLLGAGDIDTGFDPARNDALFQLLPTVPDTEKVRAKQFICDFANRRVVFPNAAAGMASQDLVLALSEPNFSITDHCIEALKALSSRIQSCKPITVLFRLGRCLGGGYEPPADFDIYASLVQELVRRYDPVSSDATQKRLIEVHWEIWNETDFTAFWNSSDPTDYYGFYDKVARAIRTVNPCAKVGGAAVAYGFNPGGAYIDGFLDHCVKSGSPIDFLTWHHYADSTSDPQNIIDVSADIDRALHKVGLEGMDHYCSEWNLSPFGSIQNYTKMQSAINAAFIVSTFIYMQTTSISKAHYYRGDALPFGLFNNNTEAGYTHAVQAFWILSQLRETPVVLSATNTEKTGIALLALTNENRSVINIVVANYHVDPMMPLAEYLPPGLELDTQHYIDSSRPVTHMLDQYSVDRWFGGVLPDTISPANMVEQKTRNPTPPTNADLIARERDYSASNNGIQIILRDMGTSVIQEGCSVRRVFSGGSLDTLSPPVVTEEVLLVSVEKDLILTDQKAKPSTVTVYRLENRVCS